MDTNTTTHTAPTPTDGSSSLAAVGKWALTVGLGATVGVGSVLLFLNDDGTTAEADTVADDTPPASEPVAPRADPPAQSEERVETQPVETETETETETTTVGSESGEVTDTAEPEAASGRPEVPTVVIGQDEDGNDIVMELEVTGGCAQTFHQPLDDESLSYIRWTYDSPGIDPGTAVRVFDSKGFDHFTAVTDQYQVIVEQGISSYGNYTYPSVEWNADDSSTMTVDPFFDHVVDDREGEASETCLPSEL